MPRQVIYGAVEEVHSSVPVMSDGSLANAVDRVAHRSRLKACDMILFDKALPGIRVRIHR